MECLGYLADGPLSAGALAEATRLTTGAITGVIDRLERAGFARREPEPNDRRKVLVRATPQAAARTAPVFAPIAQASAGVLAGYSDAELALLLHFLKKSRAAALAALAEVRQGGAERPPAERKG
jgi:DNA-binding MarR family transcriptional regulator